MTFGPDPQKRPEAQEVLKKFEARNFKPEAYTLYSYAAVQVIEQAARVDQVARPAKGRRGDQIRQGLENRHRRSRRSTRRATSRASTT